ncbi:MAG TPA: hypothetical protein DHV28_00750 [Ignavibacteriales bacterium]|nr:hypothetical protein [Ignavibacteriales bacterium]
MKSELKILIIGGCFPVQDNISRENLYHQILKKKIEKSSAIKVEINIVQYEKFYPTLEKIKFAIDRQHPDVIIFHIRVEQILRMIKFYFRYHDKNENFRRGFNLALLNISIPEKESFNLSHRSVNGDLHKKSHRILIFFNYLIGYLVLNQIYSFKIYKKLVLHFTELADKEYCKIIFTGPVSRPTTFWESYTSLILNYYMKKFISNKLEKPYLEFLGTHENQKFLFFDDYIRVNETGHNRIANLLFETLRKMEPSIIN